MVTIEKVASPTVEETRQPKKRDGDVLKSSASLAFKNLIATEVVEDDVVCGIEIAPCSSDGVSTITTAQISTDHSESWSLEREGSQDANHGFPTRVMRYKPSLFLPKAVTSHESLQNYDSLNANSPSSSLSNDGGSDDSSNPYSFHRRIDNLLKSLDDSPEAKPMFMLRFECTQYEQQDLEEDTADDPAALTCITEASDQWIEQVAPLNISPDLVFQSLISITHKHLCQLDLSSADVPFLRDAVVTNDIVPAPFMMFPEKSTVIVSRDGPVGNYTVSSRGPLAGGVLTQLFDAQGNIHGRIVKIKSYAFRDTIPPFQGRDPIPLDASTVRVRLNNWRRKNNNKKKKSEQYNSTSSFIVTTTNHPHHHGGQRRALLIADHGQQQLSPPSATASSRGTRVYCTTQMLSFVSSSSAAAASPRPSETPSDMSDEAISLFRDEELRAMMEITKDGENASALFPSFSTESEIDFCSDDGLGDEIGALDEINKELRKDLAIADILSAEILAASKFYKPTQTPISWDMRYEDEGTATTDEDEGTITTDDLELESMLESVSLSDQDDDQQQSPTLPDLPARITNLKGSRHFPSDRLDVRRRVRFAEYNDEFIFISDNPTRRSGAAAHSADAQQQSETPEWVNTLEDVYYLFEDFMDDLGYSCTQAMERNRPRPSRNKKTRASTVYYV